MGESVVDSKASLKPQAVNLPDPPPYDPTATGWTWVPRFAQWAAISLTLLLFAGLGGLLATQFQSKKQVTEQVPGEQKPVPNQNTPEDQKVLQISDTIYFCGTDSKFVEGLQTAKWPVKKILWTIDVSKYQGALTPQQIITAFDVAWQAWARWIDIEPKFIGGWETKNGEQVYNPRANDAHVYSRFGDITRENGTADGKGNVLAWSMLADGTLKQKQQMYDRPEAWAISEEAPATVIDLVRVACHEIGHVLGLEHDATGTGSLMEPVYSRKVRFPTERDATRLVAMGYARKPDIAGSPAPIVITVPSSVKVDDLIKALRDSGYKVEKNVP